MSDQTCCGACGYPVHATKEMACDWCRKPAARIEALTDKLAKAVGALTDIVKDCEAEYPPSHGAIKYFCRTTLAEIEGSTSEGENG
jgi:hypothetical protein